MSTLIDYTCSLLSRKDARDISQMVKLVLGNESLYKRTSGSRWCLHLVASLLKRLKLSAVEHSPGIRTNHCFDDAFFDSWLSISHLFASVHHFSVLDLSEVGDI